MYKQTLWSVVTFDKLIVSHLVIKKLLHMESEKSLTAPEPDEPSPPHLILFL
jgi:hypothetical protein